LSAWSKLFLPFIPILLSLSKYLGLERNIRILKPSESSVDSFNDLSFIINVRGSNHIT
jgi:hypothetical protein